MANSWGFNEDQLLPSHFSAWSKIQLGWIVPHEVEYGPNYVTSMASSDVGDDIKRIIKIGDGQHGFPLKEYLLVENRHPIGFDRAIPQGGLLISHIDDAAARFFHAGSSQTSWLAVEWETLSGCNSTSGWQIRLRICRQSR